ncbi:MAG TPA: hypothetical protein VK835_02190 [Bacteroidia bacterium]|jgi:hypothetical protein|nr:hypothetical protein [Bacteroidia bacterium]
MKTLKRLFIVSIFLGLVFVNTTCSKKITVVWQGYIYNGTKPFVGVHVSLNRCSGGGDKAPYECLNPNSVGSCITDNNGHFYISGSASSGDLYSPYLYTDSVNKVVNGWNSQTPIGLDDLKKSRYTDIHF